MFSPKTYSRYLWIIAGCVLFSVIYFTILASPSNQSRTKNSDKLKLSESRDSFSGPSGSEKLSDKSRKSRGRLETNSKRDYVKFLKNCSITELLAEFESSLTEGGPVNMETYMAILNDRIELEHLGEYWKILSSIQTNKPVKSIYQQQLIKKFSGSGTIDIIYNMVIESTGPGKDRNALIKDVFSSAPLDFSKGNEMMKLLSFENERSSALLGLSEAIQSSENIEEAKKFLFSKDRDYLSGAVLGLSNYITYNPHSDPNFDFKERINTVFKTFKGMAGPEKNYGMSMIVNNLAATQPSVVFEALSQNMEAGSSLESVITASALESLAREMAKEDPQMALKKLSDQTSAVGFSAAFREWIIQDSTASMNWYSENKDTLSVDQKEAVALNYARLALKNKEIDTAEQWRHLIASPSVNSQLAKEIDLIREPSSSP